MAILLTTSYQLIATLPLQYGEVRTYAKYSTQSKEENKTYFQLKSTYYTGQNTLSFSSAEAWLNGTLKTYGYTTFYKGETFIQEVERQMTHNDDGSSPLGTGGTAWYASFGGSGEVGWEIVFPKIDRYPMLLSAPNFNDEENPTITYTTSLGFNNASVQACISVAGQQDVVSYRNVIVSNGSYTFNLTNSEREALRTASYNKNSIGVKFILRTIANNVSYYSSVDRTMSIVNANPTMSIAIVETNSDVIEVLGSSSASTIIKNVSEPRITVTPTAVKNSNIVSVMISNDNISETLTSSPYESIIVPKTDTYSIVVTDSRGLQARQNLTKTLIDYEKVKINSFSFSRVNPTSSDIEINLDCVYYTIEGITNTVVVQYKKDDGNFETIPSSNYVIDTTNHKLTITDYLLSNSVDYRSQAEFTIKIYDLFSEAIDKETVVKGIPAMDIGEHDVYVNGNLYIADTERQNPVEVRELNRSYVVTDGTPTKTGRIVDGKEEYIYQKYISSLPNTGFQSYSTNILLNDIELVTDIGGTAYRSSDQTWFVLNASRTDPNVAISVLGGTQENKFAFYIEAGTDRTNLEAWVYVKFTYKD